ncbi:MAG: tetrahydromethanopterin synthesis protein [Rhizobiales bacterium 32-66-11]|nr:MAG: tetrahydromethanopterin synthesis protein [Rhizobiales bacterium 32-66-11]
MIRETILTTLSAEGEPHVAPMGATLIEGGYLLLPFRPSRTLDNLLARRAGVINLTDEARIFAGCVTGRKRDWPIVPADVVSGVRLAQTLAYEEFEVTEVVDDPQRPRLTCQVVHRAAAGTFCGLNRAVAAVVEGAVLVSRLALLEAEKLDREMAYLSIAIEKTGGPQEHEAWRWLCEAVADFRAGTPGREAAR